MSRGSVTVSVRVDAPAERVFAAMVDLPSQQQWMVATRLYALDGPVPVPEVGSRLAALTGLAGMGVLDTMVVTALEPPHRWTVDHTGSVIRGVGIFAVASAGAGSTVSWTEDLDLPLGVVGAIGFRLLTPAVRAGLWLSLRRLARGVAAGSLPLPGGSGTAGPSSAG